MYTLSIKIIGRLSIHPKGNCVLKTTYCTLVIKASVHSVDDLTTLACSIISNLASLNIKNFILFLLDISSNRCSEIAPRM